MSRNYDSSSCSTNSSAPSGSVAASSLKSEATDIQDQLKDIEDVALPAKKDAGKIGRKINIYTNYYRVIIDPNKTVTHFDFDIKEDNAVLGKESVRKPDEKKAFFKAFMAENFANLADKIAYDGQKSCYFMGEKELVGTTGVDAGKKFKFQYAPRGPRKRDFTVTIRRVNQFNSKEVNKYLSGHTMDLRQDAIQAFDVVLRHQAGMTMVQCGRNFFSPNQQNAKDIGSGREVWFGYHQSLKAIEGKSGGSLALNIDTAACAFMRQISGKDLMCEILSGRDRISDNDLRNHRFMNDFRRKQVEKSIKGIQFCPTHMRGEGNKRHYRCGGLTRHGAATQTFKTEDANGRTQTMNVADYYAKTYKIKLQFPDLPCIVSGNVKAGNAKFFPMELMVVAPRQRSPGKNDEVVTSNMIKAVATPAPDRKRETENQARMAIQNSQKMAKQYGIEIKTQMETQTARVLPAPALDYGDKRSDRKVTVVPRQGQWDTRDNKFYEAGKCEKWVVVNYNTRCNEQGVRNFCQQLVKTAQGSGLKTFNDPQKIFYVRDARDLETKLSQCAQNGINLCLVIMARKNTQEYSYIKSLAEIQFGVQTQCIQSRNVDKCNGQLLGNLLQKINTKMGGLNTKISNENKVAVFKRPSMVVGISISHPGPGSSAPSIISCTFTCDATVSKYVAHHRLQQSRFGLVADLRDLMVDGLKSFYNKTKKKPEKVIVYRGGGSEGELQKIAKFEVQAIKEAFQKLGRTSPYNPGLTFIVVNKMHHTRAFAADQKDMIGKSGNVPAGTLIDTNIVSKSRCDFYLAASQGIQGTSRPCHYTLVYDDNDLSMDSLTLMTWHLCHGYARCTRSVSIPVPVYYAQLDAERVARYLNEHMGSDAGSVCSGSDNSSAIQQMAVNIKVHKNIPDMYFV